MKEKLRPLEKDFIKWYDLYTKSFSYKLHKFIFPNCKRCKSMHRTYKELKRNFA